MVIEYPALIDGKDGAYGVAFPDLPGIVAMGDTRDEAISNAAEALQDYAIEADRDGMEITAPSAPDAIRLPPGCALTTVSLIRASPSLPR